MTMNDHEQQWYCSECHTYYQPVHQPQTEQPLQSQSINYFGLILDKLRSRKRIVVVIAIVIIIASISVALNDRSYNSIPIDPNDDVFYRQYPGTPWQLSYLVVNSTTLLWGNFSHDFRHEELMTVHVTPTIQNISDGFKEEYPDNRVSQTIEAYYFVAEEISYKDNDIWSSQYPVTTLHDGEGVCTDYASLLASLLYAGGLKDVAFVYTQGYNETEGRDIGHVYVAVYLPEYTPPRSEVQDKIRSYLGGGWIGLDPTNGIDGWHSRFASLNSAYECHWNITTIASVPVYGTVFSLDLGDNDWQLNHDEEFGYYFDVECELKAFEHDLDDDVTFTFELREDNVTIDREVINVTCGQDSLTEVKFVLGYLDEFNVDDYFDTVEIYLTISP